MLERDYTFDDLKIDLVPILKRMPAYTRLVILLAKDPRITGVNKAKLAAGLGYMFSPIDLVPGIIPVLGQLDDLLAALIALKSVLKSSPNEVVDPYLEKTGLSYEVIDGDIAVASRVVMDISITAAKKTGRGLLRVGRYLGRKAFKKS